jgi:hypothetical protein
VEYLTLTKCYRQSINQYLSFLFDGLSGWPAEEHKPVCAKMWRGAESSEFSIKMNQFSFNTTFCRFGAHFVRKKVGQSALVRGNV